jgi:casein kinase II subunit beta
MEEQAQIASTSNADKKSGSVAQKKSFRRLFRRRDSGRGKLENATACEAAASNTDSSIHKASQTSKYYSASAVTSGGQYMTAKSDISTASESQKKQKKLAVGGKQSKGTEKYQEDSSSSSIEVFDAQGRHGTTNSSESKKLTSLVRKTFGRMRLKDEDEEDEDEELNSSTTSESDSDDISSEDMGEYEQDEGNTNWICWFLSQPGNHFYLRVSDKFMTDEFNLAELSSKVPFYSHALSVLLDTYSSSDTDDTYDSESSKSSSTSSSENGNNSKGGNNTGKDKVWVPSIKRTGKDSAYHPTIKESRNACKLLYTLIHARYIITRHGLAHMADRYEEGYFGTCPRYYCIKTRVLPVGLSDAPGQARVQVYCPSCNDVYQLPSVFHRVDGAAFGSSFPHIFFKTYSEFVQQLPPVKVYEPRIYGFKLYRKPLSLVYGNHSSSRKDHSEDRKPSNSGNCSASQHTRRHHRHRSVSKGDIQSSDIISNQREQATLQENAKEFASNIALVETNDSAASATNTVALRKSTVLENMSWIRILPNYNRPAGR